MTDQPPRHPPPRHPPSPRESLDALARPVLTAAARLVMRYDGHGRALRNAAAAVDAGTRRAQDRTAAERRLAAAREERVPRLPRPR